MEMALEGCNSGRGFGTRLSEETVLKPKPMVEIGGGDPLAYNETLFSLWT